MEKRDTGGGGEILIGTSGMVAGSDVWRRARRIVVKIGSALLVDRATGRVRATWLNSLADDIAALRSAGKEVVLFSSGAIALGRRVLGLTQGAVPQFPLTLLNSVIAISALSGDLFPGRAVGTRAMALSVGAMNLGTCLFGAMPCCHGSGGLAGQHRVFVAFLTCDLASEP